MFQFSGFTTCVYTSSTCRVAPFGHQRIIGRLHLPVAFRSLPRPSSPPGAKASPIRPYFASNSLIKSLPCFDQNALPRLALHLLSFTRSILGSILLLSTPLSPLYYSFCFPVLSMNSFIKKRPQLQTSNIPSAAFRCLTHL